MKPLKQLHRLGMVNSFFFFVLHHTLLSVSSLSVDRRQPASIRWNLCRLTNELLNCEIPISFLRLGIFDVVGLNENELPRLPTITVTIKVVIV